MTGDKDLCDDLREKSPVEGKRPRPEEISADEASERTAEPNIVFKLGMYALFSESVVRRML